MMKPEPSPTPTPTDIPSIRARAEAATPIPGYAGYSADAEGNIWSTVFNWRGYGPRKLTAVLNAHGYPSVRLMRGGKRIHRPVHALVAAAFMGIRPIGLEVRHLDGNRLNNCISNLAYGTALENARDRGTHGKTAKGSENGFAVLTEAKVIGIRERLAAGLSQRITARLFGVSKRTIRRIAKKEGWAHVA